MWRIHVRIVLILIILTVAGGIVFVLTNYRYLLKPENMPISQMTSHVDIGLQTVHHVAVKNGKKQWELQSDDVQRISSDSFFSPLTVTFFPNTGDPIGVSSEKGCVKDNKNIEINGHIVISQPPWTISCDALIYSYTHHKITGNNNIAITGPGMMMTANALHYDLSSGQVTVQDSIELTVTRWTGSDK
ncbi:MAG: LPS export ABC transporter periplasmic protein LptC [Candidatus Magnetomorum sp.]|nr:LPS export ABC transporter periplasmic protein LptC [Candidatus Magnetomorum sp.]